MVLRWTFLSILFLAGFAFPEKRTYSTHNYYVLRHDPVVPSRASLDDIVRALDVELVEQAGELLNHWIVKRRKRTGDLVAREATDPVLSAFQSLQEKAASPFARRSEDVDLARRIVSSIDYLSLQILRERVKRAPPSALPPTHDTPLPPTHDTPSKAAADHFGIQDPLFPQQWHLINDQFPQHTMNVTGLWDAGFTGKGVISSFIDDGLDYTSEDLAVNFVRHFPCSLFVINFRVGCI
jgi:kexin